VPGRLALLPHLLPDARGRGRKTGAGREQFTSTACSARYHGAPRTQDVGALSGTCGRTVCCVCAAYGFSWYAAPAQASFTGAPCFSCWHNLIGVGYTMAGGTPCWRGVDLRHVFQLLLVQACLRLSFPIIPSTVAEHGTIWHYGAACLRLFL